MPLENLALKKGTEELTLWYSGEICVRLPLQLLGPLEPPRYSPPPLAAVFFKGDRLVLEQKIPTAKTKVGKKWRMVLKTSQLKSHSQT